MTLGFSTNFKNGTRTNFIEKIWACYVEQGYALPEFWSGWFDLNCIYDFDGNNFQDVFAKCHSIRRDEHNKWKDGMDIHPVIFNRTSKRFQFAPTIKCIRTQNIFIRYNDIRIPIVFVDGINLTTEELSSLAVNDGFGDTKEFLSYFNTDFKGKIIHWTDIKY